MRRWVSGAAIVAGLVVAGALVATAPDEEAITAPLLVTGVVGETVSGRDLVAVVDDVRLTRYLDVKYREAGDTSTVGVWVVVDTVLTSRIDPVFLSSSELWIGSVRYRISDILPNPSPLQLPYGPGIPQRGSLVFEIPAGALDDPGASHASVVLYDRVDSRLDSVPVIVVDLTGLEISARERIDEPSVVSP